MTTPCTDAGPYWDLVEQSLEEAEFLWKRWEADLSSLTRNLAATSTWTEERLHGALDGVRIAGERIVEVAAGALGSGNLAAQTVAAHLLASAVGLLLVWLGGSWMRRRRMPPGMRGF